MITDRTDIPDDSTVVESWLTRKRVFASANRTSYLSRTENPPQDRQTERGGQHVGLERVLFYHYM